MNKTAGGKYLGDKITHTRIHADQTGHQVSLNDTVQTPKNIKNFFVKGPMVTVCFPTVLANLDVFTEEGCSLHGYTLFSQLFEAGKLGRGQGRGVRYSW